MTSVTMNTILYCRHWNETKDFYLRVLKLPVLESRSWFVEFEVTPSSRLSIADEKHTRVKSSRGLGHCITLQVADLEELRRSLLAAGASPGPVRRHPWGSRVMDLCDPEGNKLEFWTAET